MTSRDVCNRIARLVRPAKVGHTGTLDPLATGVLLVAVGSASRLVEFSHAYRKQYLAQFQLGAASETLDTDSPVQLLPEAPQPALAELEAVTRRWIGTVQQVPPKYSALNVAGRRAHQLARQGADFELPAREITIHDIRIVHYDYPQLTLSVDCGTGTYIRSLGSDVARQLGSDAVMSQLVRTRIGPFAVEECIALEHFCTAADVAQQLRPAQWLIADWPRVTLDAAQAAQIRCGIPLLLPEASGDNLVALDQQQRLVAVLARTPAPHTYRSLRVFHDSRATTQPSPISKPHSPES